MNYLRLIYCCLICFYSNHSVALSTDQDQPIEIEADSAEVDDTKGLSTYRGNVVITQGTIRIIGDTMTIHYNEQNDLETLIMEGKPVRYRQLPDNSQVYDEAEAERMEYHKAKNLVILIDKVSFRQENASFSGARIEYDTARGQIKARSQDKQDPQAPAQERVKIILKQKLWDDSRN